MSTIARFSPESFLKLSADVSSFYGFRPVRELERALPPALRQRGMHSFSTVAAVCGTPSTTTSSVLGTQEPVLAYYATPTPSYLPGKLSANEAGEFGLFISGAGESMGEVLLIKVVVAILAEHGVPVSSVRVNALGDRESQQRFAREISIFLKKHASALAPTPTEGAPSSPFDLYRLARETCPDIVADAPRSVNFLSEKSRSHFRSMLEQLEALNLTYQLDHSLISDDREQRVLFALDIEGSDTSVCAAVGGRYDDFMHRIHARKDGSAVHASIFFRRKGVQRSSFTTPLAPQDAKVYFVQLGARAKLQGLTVIDMLRTARIPAMQSFDTAHLSDQLAAARGARVPYVLIMGQREVLDGTIIVRSALRNTQTTVPLVQLPRYLKTLRV